MENKRRKTHQELESVPVGYANGVAEGFPLNESEKQEMILKAADAYGEFLDALKCDWRNDPNSMETPMRVAKKYVLEQWSGRYNNPPSITSFPSDNYQGMVLECNIPLTSMCSHHHESILGRVHIAYIPGEGGDVIGLSKLNRLVEHFGRRGAIQEQLTMAIHQSVDKVCEGNIGVAVSIIASHSCVSCRGTGHRGASMVTNELSGVFREKSEVRKEYFDSITMANNLKDSH
jgi:GTP cyclohydrolase I